MGIEKPQSDSAGRRSDSDDRKPSKIDRLGWAQLIFSVIAGVCSVVVFLQYDRIADRLNEEKTITEIEKNKQDIAKANSSPITVDDDIAISRYVRDHKKPRPFAVDFHYRIKNISGKTVTVSEVVIYALLLQPQFLGTADFSEIPVVVVSAVSPWKPVASRAYTMRTANSCNEGDSKRDCVDGLLDDKVYASTTGGGIGDLAPGEEHTGSFSLMVRADKYDYVGFFMRIELNSEGQQSTARPNGTEPLNRPKAPENADRDALTQEERQNATHWEFRDAYARLEE